MSRRRCSRSSASARGSASWRPFRWPRLAARSSAFSRSAFGVAGVYFAILTIAFAEFARIGFDHLGFVNGSTGLFLPVAQYAHNDLWRLRGGPTMFYYVILAATVLAFLLCHVLLQSRIGYFWLAIREDEQAARAAGINTFRYKMFAVMISAAVTSFAGVFYAFFYNNLFPEQVFSISRSIEIILGPIIGGIGTLFGPILGAFVLTGLAETLNSGDGRVRHRSAGRQAGVLRHLPAARVVALPDGVWPPLARRLGLRRSNNERAARSTASASVSAAWSRSTASASPCRRARSLPSSARTAPARPRCST